MSRSDMIEIDAKIEHETVKAFLLDVGLEEPIWFAKSTVKNNNDGTFSLPEWLAREKGAI